MALASDDPRRIRVERFRFTCPACTHELTKVLEAGSLDHRLSCGRCGLVVKLPIVAAAKAVRWLESRR